MRVGGPTTLLEVTLPSAALGSPLIFDVFTVRNPDYLFPKFSQLYICCQVPLTRGQRWAESWHVTWGLYVPPLMIGAWLQLQHPWLYSSRFTGSERHWLESGKWRYIGTRTRPERVFSTGPEPDRNGTKTTGTGTGPKLKLFAPPEQTGIL